MLCPASLKLLLLFLPPPRLPEPLFRRLNMSDLYWLEPDELLLLVWLLLVRGAFWKEVVGMSRTIDGEALLAYVLCL